MASSSYLFLLVLACVGAGLAAGDEEGCVPGTVSNLVLSGSDTLTWETPSTEQCDILSYLVHVAQANGTIQFTYRVLFPIVHTNILERCIGYTFRVFQISTDNITGPAFSIYTLTPPDSNANLALDYIKLTQNGTDVTLEYSLEEQHARCANHYRIVVYNEDTDATRSIYTTRTSLVVNNVVPCGHYTFAVQAMFTLVEDGPSTVLRHNSYAGVTTAPHMASVVVADTSADFVWHLEEYVRNRCDISSLIIDGSPYFNVSYTIRDQANRTPLSLRLTGLAADTMYFLRVTALNTAGPSGPAQIAIQTLPSS